MQFIREIYSEYIGSAIYGSETVRMLKMQHRIYLSDGINGVRIFKQKNTKSHIFSEQLEMKLKMY